MGKFLYLISFLAQLDPTYYDAGDNARRALLETPMMKQELAELQSESERYLFTYTGVTKDELAYAGYLYPVFTGKLSSKPFKNFRHVTENHWTIRPEIEYTFKTKESSTFLIFTKEF